MGSPTEEQTLHCERCGAHALELLPPVARGCVPFPELRGVLCGSCGAQGTRVVLGGRATITWGEPLPRPLTTDRGE